MANFVKHEPCPNCGSRNNLGRYDDGSAWCFGGCGFWQPPTHGSRVAKLKDNTEEEVGPRKWFDLPDDCSAMIYGKPAMDYILKKSAASPLKLRKENVVWSEGWQQLIFKFMANGVCVGWQARNFGLGAEKRKCFTSGDVGQLLPIYGEKDNRKELCIVEGPLDAINVSQVMPCMPLLGSSIPLNKVHALSLLYDNVIIWLDDDKYKEGVAMSLKFEQVGIPTTNINTANDPKTYTVPELRKILA